MADQRPENPPAESVVLPPEKVRRMVLGGASVAVAAGAANLALASGNLRQAAFSWLLSGLFFVSLGLGGLFFVLLLHLTRAGWGVAVRRLAEQVMGTLPWMMLALLPLAWALPELYPWARPAEVALDPLLTRRAGVMNPEFFLVRAAIFALSWSLVVGFLRRLSIGQDRGPDPGQARGLMRWSAPALAWVAVSVTMASFDWLMSLDPHWYSTVFGVYFFSGSLLALLALLSLTVVLLDGSGLLQSVLGAGHRHDLGKLLFAFVVFWAYIAFCQFMLIWYADLPEETAWFALRWTPGWRGVSIALVLSHFVVPFFFLLPQSVKRRPLTLGVAAVWVLAAHFLDLYWLVMPYLHPDDWAPRGLDLLSLLTWSGLFVAALGRLARGRALVPIGDPRLAESITLGVDGS